MIEYVKQWMIILAVCVSSKSVFAEESIPVCVHEFHSDTVSVPTCVEEGSVKFFCALNDDSVYYEVLPVIDHLLERDSVAATCRAEGFYSDSCTICHQVISSVTLPQLSHVAQVDTMLFPTCEMAGNVVVRCSLCQDTLETEILPMLTHVLERDSVAATCHAEGLYSDSCTICHQVISSVTLPQLSHVAQVDTMLFPTCEMAGNVVVRCSLCLDTLETEILPMLSHVLERDSVAATCYAEGLYSDSCTVCHQVISSIALPQLSHVLQSDTFSISTCITEGIVHSICAVCHDTIFTEYLPMLGHDWARDSVAATCQTEGHYIEYCNRCGMGATLAIYPVLEHDYVVTTTPASCLEDGITLQVCSYCHDTVQMVEPAIGHSFQFQYIEPTCQHLGYDLYVCEYCHKSDTLGVYEMTGHNLEWEMAVYPTCTEEGLYVGTCVVCGQKDEIAYPTSGHMYICEMKSPPTCTEDGLDVCTCATCGHREENVYPAQGHWYMQSDYVSPSCTKDGYEAYECWNCGYSYKKIISASGHFYDSLAVDPTPIEQGYSLHTCSRCGDSYKDRFVDKLDAKDYYTSLKISELMPCNISTIMNHSDYNFTGYLELHNGSKRAVNLRGCILSHYKKTSKGQYSLKWTSGLDEIVTSGYHILWMGNGNSSGEIPYKLDADGGYLTLYAGNLLIDSIAYGAMEPHVAYGRDGSSEGYMIPTPSEKNGAVYASLVRDRCAQPTFSVNPGIVAKATQLSLSSATAGAAIYYTLDGTEPSASNGLLYTEPIDLKENANIRAVAYLSGKLPSKIVTGSYIFMDKRHASCGGFTVPIVSITMDDLYYGDPYYGMFVEGKNGVSGEKDCQRMNANYNRDWKRPMNFEYFVDGKCVVSQEVEAAIEGGCSRGKPIKSFSMKTSKKTGASQFDYHFFESKPDVFTRTLHVRNGGTAYECIPYRDGLMQTFAHGMNIDYQGYQPVAYYRNGRYVGMMALNERTNSDYIKSNHGYDEEDIDVLTVSDQLGIQVSKGSKSAYDELVSYLNDNSPANPAYYKGACSRMDMDEYIDYQIFQQFIVNTDWPGNNTKIWRAKDNGLFRWILFDTDFGFGLCGYDWISNERVDMIDWCRGGGFSSWANEKSWMTNIFKPLSKNKEFEKKFTTKFLINLSDRFSAKNIDAVFDSIVGIVETEACVDGRTSSGYGSGVEGMRSFAKNRSKYIYKHLTSYVKGDSTVNFSLSSNVAGAILTLNGEKLPTAYNGKYIAGYDFDLEAYAPMGYVFERWEISDSAHIKISNSVTPASAFLPGLLSGKVKRSMSIKAIFKKGNSSLPTLAINELCASSNSQSGNADDYGDYPDWIELYNYGENDINLAGFALTNAKSGKVSDLPYNSDDLVIKAGEHKLLWAKGDNRRGSSYLDFKLDNDKASQICLSYFDATGEVDVDCVRYKTHAANESYGRIVDNGDDWTIFGVCDDSITYAATPMASNGSLCEHYTTLVTEPLPQQEGMDLYPNPSTDYLNLVTEEEILSYTIYDMSGRALLREAGNEKSISVEDLNAGFYIIEVETENETYRLKFLKE